VSPRGRNGTGPKRSSTAALEGGAGEAGPNSDRSRGDKEQKEHGRQEPKGHKAGDEGRDRPQARPEDGEADRRGGEGDPDELLLPPPRDQGPARRRPGGAGGEDRGVGAHSSLMKIERIRGRSND